MSIQISLIKSHQVIVHGAILKNNLMNQLKVDQAEDQQLSKMMAKCKN